MKRHMILYMACLMSIAVLYAQNTKAKYSDESAFKALPTKLIYPEAAVSTSEEGDVVLSFTITSSGKLDNVNIDNTPSMNLSISTMSAFSSLGASWEPAMDAGQAVDKKYKMVFRYRMASTIMDYKKSAEKAMEKDKADKALKIISKGISDNPFDKSLYAVRADIHTKLGMEEEAKNDQKLMDQIENEILAVYNISSSGGSVAVAE